MNQNQNRDHHGAVGPTHTLNRLLHSWTARLKNLTWRDVLPGAEETADLARPVWRKDSPC